MVLKKNFSKTIQIDNDGITDSIRNHYGRVSYPIKAGKSYFNTHFPYLSSEGEFNMNEELKNEMRATINASIPALAVYSGETEQMIRDITHYSVTQGLHQQTGAIARVLVWRISRGFEEYAVFRTTADGEERIHEPLTTVEPGVGLDYLPTGTVYSVDDDGFDSSALQHAIDFMRNYDAHQEGHRVIFVLRDWNQYIDTNPPFIDEQLSLFEEAVLGNNKTVIMLSPSRWTPEPDQPASIPHQLQAYVRTADYPLPTKEDRIEQIQNELTAYVNNTALPAAFRNNMRQFDHDDVEAFADACAGMTRHQIADTLVMSAALYHDWRMDFILDEKRKSVEKAGFTLIRPSTGFENIGGLTPLKTWIRLISKRFTQAARDYGFIRNIRGLLMAGVPGCGKTAIAKAMANEMNMNILMVEATNLKGSLVGQSEAKVHRLLEIAKSAAPLIVFVDEAEKLLGKSEGVHDGGAHDAVLGQFLTFMQEDDSGVMFVFTANNMDKFAPELVDRFEGRFFIDLPEPEEREEIIKIHLRLRNQDVERFDIPELVKKTSSFSGRNIEDGIEEAMTVSFSEDRPLEMEDMVSVFNVLVPTSKTKKKEIEHMRSYVEKGYMRKANIDSTKRKRSSTSRVDSLREF